MRVMVLHLLLFIGLAEDEIHRDDEPRDHDRNEENGVIFGLLLQFIDELNEQVTVIDDLCKHDCLKSDEEGYFSCLVADGRVEEIGQQNVHTVENTTSLAHCSCLCGVIIGMTAKYLEIQDADKHNQPPRNDELHLRLHE